MSERKHQRAGWLGIGCIFAVYLLAAAWIVRTKRPWVDEAWFAGPAVDLAAHGRLGTPLLDPAGSHLRLYRADACLRGINQRTYWVMPLHLLQLGLWGEFFGTSIFSMRIPGVLWGLVALASVGIMVGRLLGGRRAAATAMAVLAVDFGFLDSAADARMDMTCAGFGLAALAAYLVLRENRFRAALFVSHSLAAAACFTHPNGAFGAAALVLTTIYLDRKRWREMNPVLVLAPYAAGGVAWGLYGLQSPGEFSAQFFANAAGRGSDLLAPWRGIWREVSGRWMVHYWPAESWPGRLKVIGLLLALLASAAVAMARPLRNSAGCRLLLLLTLLRFLLLSVGANGKFTYYMVHMVPYFAILIGIAAAYAFAQGNRPVRAAAGGVLLLYFAVQGAVLWHRAAVVNGYANEYQPTIAFLKSNTLPGDLIAGGAELGFGLGFYNPQLVDDVWLGYWSHRRPTIVVADRWYYKDVMDTATQRAFPVRGYFTQLLGREFELIREIGGYRIYRRRP